MTLSDKTWDNISHSPLQYSNVLEKKYRPYKLQLHGKLQTILYINKPPFHTYPSLLSSLTPDLLSLLSSSIQNSGSYLSSGLTSGFFSSFIMFTKSRNALYSALFGL